MSISSCFSFCVHLIAEALEHWEGKAVRNNPGRAFAPLVEAASIFVAHFADEMLFRAVILQGEPSDFISIGGKQQMQTLMACWLQ